MTLHVKGAVVMTDKHLLEQMEATLKRLSVPVEVTEYEAAESLPE